MTVASVLAENAGVRVHTATGSAGATGLPAGTFDLVMLRHVPSVITPLSGMRGPAWTARDAMIAEGLVIPEGIAHWDQAFRRAEREGREVRFFAADFVAFARRPRGSSRGAAPLACDFSASGHSSCELLDDSQLL